MLNGASPSGLCNFPDSGGVGVVITDPWLTGVFVNVKRNKSKVPSNLLTGILSYLEESGYSYYRKKSRIMDKNYNTASSIGAAMACMFGRNLVN
jgi:hypothetical protein